MAKASAIVVSLVVTRNRFWFGIRIQSFIPSGRSGSREPPLRTSTVSHFRCCRMFLLRSFIAGARIGEGRDWADRNGDIRRCSARRARCSSPARRPPAKLQWPVDFSLPIQRGKRGTAKSTTRKPWERHFLALVFVLQIPRKHQ